VSAIAAAARLEAFFAEAFFAVAFLAGAFFFVAMFLPLRRVRNSEFSYGELPAEKIDKNVIKHS
jgi:hypothetical protein